MGGVLASLLARRSRGGRFIIVGGDFCRWFSAHLVAKQHAVDEAACHLALGACVCGVCFGFIDGLGIFTGDARGAFYVASILVFMDCVGIFDALCAFGAD